MSSAIIDGTNIDTSVFSYGPPKAHSAGGKVVNLYNKHSRESLTIATPLIFTWGAQEGKDTQGNFTGKWTMSLQFPNNEHPNPDCEAFLNSLRALENKVKSDAMTYSKDWFGKVITNSEVIDEKFNVMLRHPKKDKNSAELDMSKPPTLTVKIPCWSGVWQSEIYDEEGTPLYIKGKSTPDVSPLTFLKPKIHVICLIQCGGLWFVNGKVSITWNLKQAIVQKPRASSIAEGVCFLVPKASDKEKLKTLPPPEDDIDPDGAVAAFTVDSDDEREDIPAPIVHRAPPVPPLPEPTPTPAPVAASTEEPKKKRVITKKSG
jgi:hypothetical protein